MGFQTMISIVLNKKKLAKLNQAFLSIHRKQVYMLHKASYFVKSQLKPLHETNRKELRKKLDYLSRSLGIEQQADWYSISGKDLSDHGGASLLHNFNDSLSTALRSLYPEFEWHSFLFQKCPQNFWMNETRLYFDWISDQLLIQTQQEWYKITNHQLRNLFGSKIMDFFNDSIYNALCSVYPEFEWNPLSFQRVPKAQWKNVHTQRRFFDKIAEDLRIEKQEDWYSVTKEQIKQRGGSPLYHYYSTSIDALRNVYPEFEWDSLRLHRLPKMHLSEKENHRNVFDRLAESIGIETQQDWYKLTLKQLQKIGGSKVEKITRSLKAYHPYGVLKSVYPEYEWLPWQFHTAPNSSWENNDIQRKCLDWSADELGIMKLSDWVSIPLSTIYNSLGSKLFLYFGSLKRTMQMTIPEHDWDALWKLSEGQQSTMNILKNVAKGEVLQNHRLRVEGYPSYIELDIYIPEYSLAIEYQGFQHYHHTYRNSLIPQQERDRLKRKICSDYGITLLEVPYWWDSTPSRLFNAIQKIRNDIPLHLPLSHQHHSRDTVDASELSI